MIYPGWAVWITGLPASGKSTVAGGLIKYLDSLGIEVQVLESDVVRKVITPNPNYSPEERESFYRILVYIGVLLTKNGVNVIFDATAHKRKWRRAARGLIDKFLQVYIRCPLEVCRERDPKDIYRGVTTGEAAYVPGVQEVFEEPWHADIELNCLKDSPNISVKKIIEAMKENDFI